MSSPFWGSVSVAIEESERWEGNANSNQPTPAGFWSLFPDGTNQGVSASSVRSAVRRTRTDGKPKGRLRPLTPAVTAARPDLRIVDQALWDQVQARLRDRGEAYLRQTGGKFYGWAEHSRESRYLWSGSLQCGQCGGAMVVGKKTYHPPQSWDACSFYLKRGTAVCANGVTAPVEALDAAILDTVEKEVLTPEALSYVFEKFTADVRRSLTQNPEQIAALRKRRGTRNDASRASLTPSRTRSPPRVCLARSKPLRPNSDGWIPRSRG